MAKGLNFVKMPRNVTEYTLMKGVTDYSNIKQFDMFETGYSFLTVVGVPQFMHILGNDDADLKALEDGFVHIMEGEFRGLSGLPDITVDPGTITNGVNELQLINNVTMDTSISVEMSFFERSGSLITKYLDYYLTGIKDPYSKAKTYHGLVGTVFRDPSPEYEIFTFLYYVTDNTMRKVEKAYLLCNAQPTLGPDSQLYNSTRGDMGFVELQISFNCFPIVGDVVNMYASMMLQNDLTVPNGDPRKLILDHNDFEWAVMRGGYKQSIGRISGSNPSNLRQTGIVENTGRVADLLNRNGNTGAKLKDTALKRYQQRTPLGDIVKSKNSDTSELSYDQYLDDTTRYSYNNP